MSKTDATLAENIDWPVLLFNLKAQKLIPFLGAGASLGFGGNNGLPGGGKLAELLAEECGYPGNDRWDLLRVAQYYSLRFGELGLRESLQKKISLPGVQPGEVHNILAGWPVNVVLTTNYDNLMERAFAMAGKDPAKEIYNRFGDQEQIQIEPTEHTPLIDELHGSLDHIDSMVITENNYNDFMISLIEGNPTVPDFISKNLSTRSLLLRG